MTGPDYFNTARIPEGRSEKCLRCGLVMIHVVWIRQKPGDPTQTETACCKCAESIEIEEATKEDRT